MNPQTREIGVANTTSQAPVEAPMEQISPEFNVISFGRGVLNFPKTSSNFISAYTPINSEEAQLVLKNARTNFTTRAITKGYREPLLYMKTVRTPEDAYLTLYQKSPKTSEELTILEKFKRLYNGGGGNIGHNGRQVVMLNPRHPQKDVVANHEIAHYLLKPSQKAPSKDIFNYELAESTFPDRAKGYFSHRGGTELTSRGTQIHDWLGHSGNEPITTQELIDASQNYTKTTGVDNVMTEFFKGIKDYDKMAKWLSENAIQYGLPITTGISTYRMSQK